jgi:hypothetical protein
MVVVSLASLWKGYELLREKWMYYPSLAKNSQRLYAPPFQQQLAVSIA